MCKKIVFLDFDGVMDTLSYDSPHKESSQKDKWGTVFNPECVENLKYIIEQTGAEIVITSSWKDFMSYNDLLEMWRDRNLPGCVIGTTPTIGIHRGQEIEEWLCACEYECQYVILDDLGSYDFNENQLPYLLCINPYEGITIEIAKKAVNILNK